MPPRRRRTSQDEDKTVQKEFSEISDFAFSTISSSTINLSVLAHEFETRNCRAGTSYGSKQLSKYESEWKEQFWRRWRWMRKPQQESRSSTSVFRDDWFDQW
jgi:hypothetical protein